MTEQAKQSDFATALKAAILESLTQRRLVTPVEKTAFQGKNLSSK